MDEPTQYEYALYMIFNLLDQRDTIRMGAVCKSWLSVSRWSMRSRPQPPWLMVFSTSIYGDIEKEEADVDPYYQDIEREEIEEVDPYYQDIEREEIQEVDPDYEDAEREEIEEEVKTVDEEVKAEAEVPFFLNSLSDKKFPEIQGKCCYGSDARGWLLTRDHHGDNMELFHVWSRTQVQLPPLLPPPPDVQRIRVALSDDAAVVAIIVLPCETFAIYRIGDKAWTSVTCPNWPDASPCPYCHYQDIIFSRGKFYAVSHRGRVAILHVNTTNPYVETLSRQMTEYEIRHREDDSDIHHREDDSDQDDSYQYDNYTEQLERARIEGAYLGIDSESESLFIIFKRLWYYGFYVFELGLEESGQYQRIPVTVESLGSRVVFLGERSSTIITSSEFAGLDGNCIYFFGDYYYPSLHIFKMEGKCTKTFNYGHVFMQPMWISAPMPCNEKGTIIKVKEDDLEVGESSTYEDCSGECSVGESSIHEDGRGECSRFNGFLLFCRSVILMLLNWVLWFIGCSS